MPIFEYCCKGCGEEFESLVFNEEEDRAMRCPACRGEDVERTLSCFSRPFGSGGSGGAFDSSCKPGKSRFK